MPLSDKEKTEARDAMALALELNEPETMLEGLKRLCVKKALDARLGDNERARFQDAANALIDVQRDMWSDKAPAKRQGYIDEDNGQYVGPAAQEAPGEHNPDN